MIDPIDWKEIQANVAEKGDRLEAATRDDLDPFFCSIPENELNIQASATYAALLLSILRELALIREALMCLTQKGKP